MKKMYLLVLLCLCFSSVNSQIVANDDVTPTLHPSMRGATEMAISWVPPFDLLANDSYSGLVDASLVSATHPGISVNAYGGLWLSGDIPEGTYFMVYQICDTFNPGDCDTATVTVNICNNEAIGETIYQDCTDDNGRYIFSNLPEGNWTMTKMIDETEPEIIQGSGSTYVIEDPVVDQRCVFFVTNEQGCTARLGFQGTEFWHRIRCSDNQQVQDTNGDGIINVGDSLIVTFLVENNSDCPIYNVTVLPSAPQFLPSWLEWTIIAGAPVAEIPAYSSNNEIQMEIVLTQEIINRTYAGFYLTIGFESAFASGGRGALHLNLGWTDGIIFKAFIDANENGTRDDGETDITKDFTYEINDDGVVHTISGYGWDPVIYESDPTTSYDLGFVPQTSRCTNYLETNTVFENVTVPVGSGMTTYDFPLSTLESCTNLAVGMSAGNRDPRPARTHRHHIYYRNEGNQVVSTATINYMKEPLGTIASVSNEAAVITPTGFTLDFTDLSPGEHGSFYVDIALPEVPVINMDDVVTATVSITTDAVEDFLTDNQRTLTQVVRNSYDPNSKEEIHGSEILFSGFTSDDYLEYTIHFENIGTAEANLVRITDTLDEKLDASTFRVLHATHPVMADRGGNDLTFTFSGIDLPPSVPDTEIGHGSVTYRIKPLPGYQPGDIIHNTANIYFDGNESIVTNTVTTTFVAELSISDLSKTTLRLYPNPAKANFQVSGAAIQSMEIFDMTGKMVFSKTENAASGSVDVSGLAGGIYLVKVKTDVSVETIRFVKE